ncbi:MAG: hypothetical protein AAF600_15565 [Bacteroidota bacterium]
MRCDRDEESVSSDSNLGIVFSTDTIAFDTLLSSSLSSTRRLLVFNPNKSAIRFSNISLAFGRSSDYSVIINGREATSVSDEVLFGGDSLLILVAIDINPRNEDDPYIVRDSIIFEWNSNVEHVKLLAYGQDTQNLTNESLCNVVWSSDRPYTVDGTVVVEVGCTLTIEKGTHVFFNNDALLLVQGNIIAMGDSSNNIVFTSSRFDSGFDVVPGQWAGIILTEESNAQFSFCTIENSEIGIGSGYTIRVKREENRTELVPGPISNTLQTELSMSNMLIKNCSLAGVLAFNSLVQSTNALIYNCGEFLFAGLAGGTYQLYHHTLSNDPSPFLLESPSVQFADNTILDGEILTDELILDIKNSIIWGPSSEELLINNGGGSSLSLMLNSNIIRSSEEIENNFTSLENNFPGFKDPFLFDYSLDTLSFAKDKGKVLEVSIDIIGAPRDVHPDIGAFERIEN